MQILPVSFYLQPTEKVARELLGCYLIHYSAEGICSGRIVETEAYLANDPASHSFKGSTNRNSAMFGPAGRAYIYFIYGKHFCFNVVTGPEGIGEAVLIRALEPKEGIPLMQNRRQQTNLLQLCNGPAKLVQALGIEKSYNNHPLQVEPVIIARQAESSMTDPHPAITVTGRIGLSQSIDLPLRYYLQDNPFVSQRHTI